LLCIFAYMPPGEFFDVNPWVQFLHLKASHCAT